MKKYKIYLGALLMLLFVTVTSCDNVGDIEIGGTSVESMAGDWWVIALNPDDTPAFAGDYVHFSTYNVAADDGGMWIDDFGNWFEIKSRVRANVDNLTFSGDVEAPNEFGGWITITSGVIVKEAYEAESGTMVDSIYFEAEVDWFPGTIFKFVGHKRSGFGEDENPHY